MNHTILCSEPMIIDIDYMDIEYTNENIMSDS